MEKDQGGECFIKFMRQFKIQSDCVRRKNKKFEIISSKSQYNLAYFLAYFGL